VSTAICSSTNSRTARPSAPLLQLLAAGRDDLCLVGDPRQSIFGFAGVEPDSMARVRADFPGTVTVELNTNHRSTTRIVAAANELIDARLKANTDEPGPAVTVTNYQTETDEAHGIARMIRMLGQPWSQRAVLAGLNAALDTVEAACLVRGIPTQGHKTCSVDPRPVPC